jgi:lipid II:glycine glycyltransferase (peptidoglycan interpeptide bridge formation enzyme)
MELIYLTSARELNNFIQTASSEGAEFLQSWPWGKISQSGGAEILRVGVSEDRGPADKSADKSGRPRKILVAMTLIKKPILAGRFYWFAPRGPIFSKAATGRTQEIMDFLGMALQKRDRRAIFFRLEPNRLEPNRAVSLTNQESHLVRQIFPLKKTIDQEPAQTLILDLGGREEDLLAAMQQKTRYNIRLAEKKGVKIRLGTAGDFPEFWRLMTVTARRDNFREHSAEHYRNLLTGSADFIRLYLAEYEGRVIAAGLFCFWGDQVTYLHGASDNDFRSVMAPYLLQWSLIKEACTAGYRYYDFYGIDEKKWPGVTRFKKGFGGRSVEYPGTYDAVFRPAAYWFYNRLRKLRRLL